MASWTRRTAALVFSTVWLVFSSLIAVAAEPGSGVAFLDDGELSIAVEPGVSKDVQVWIVNGGPSPAELSLRVISPSGPEGGPPMALSKPLSADAVVEASGTPVAQGATWAPIISVSGDVPSGTYTAQLVAISGDGSHVSRDVTVTVNGTDPTESDGSGRLSPPLPDPLTLHGERAPFAWFQGGQLAVPVTVALDPEIAASGKVGPLMDDRGRLAYASLSPDGTITINSTPAAGTYKGTLSHADSAGEQEQLATVSLTARDYFLWPLAALLLGLSLAIAIERWFTHGAPRRALEARLAELQEESRRQSAESRTRVMAIADWIGDNRDPVELQAVSGPGGVLGRARDEALRDFDETPSAATRDERWGAQGTEFTKVREYLDSQAELGDLAMSSNQAYAELKQALGEEGEAFAASNLADDARKRIAGGLIESVPGLRTKVDERRDVAARLSKALDLARIINRLDAKLIPQDPRRAEVRSLRARLAAMPRGTLEEVNEIATAANDLWSRVISAPDDESKFAVELDPNNYETLAWALQSFFAPDSGGGPGDARLMEPTSRELRASLARNNWLYMFATGIFIVAAPFGTQYLSNPAFGSEADYVALLVWSFTATAVAQLLKQASSMVRLRGRTDPGWPEGQSAL